MLTLLSRLLIKDHQNTSSPAVRLAYGTLCGALGIALNLLLFAGKFFAGLLSGSIAVTADAFNNLSDAGSSLITLIGFSLAGQKPDAGHPFGHGRIEYITGLMVSIAIILMGVELLKSAVGKILAPEPATLSPLAVMILIASILVKIYMALYNRAVSKKIDSAAMAATSMDSLSDTIATSVVLVSMLVSYFFSVNIDGYCALLVSGFILFAGLRSAKDTISPLLGQPPTAELVGQIQQIVLAYPDIKGMHDLIVHNYGPGRMMISLHAEVPASGDLLHLHDDIDNIERELREQLGCDAVVHMDPIVTDDQLTSQTREKIQDLVKVIDERLTIHDFRMVHGPTHTNVIFDVVVPFGVSLSDEQVRDKVTRLVRSLDGNYFAVLQIDRAYV